MSYAALLQDDAEAVDLTSGLLNRARALLDAGRLDAARHALRAVQVAVQGPSAELCELLGRLLLGEGRVTAALELFDRAVATWPHVAALRLGRADARAAADDPGGAAADAAEAVMDDPADARPKALLGLLLLRLGRVKDARPCLAAAVAAQPSDVPARLGLAQALDSLGDAAAARATLDDGVRRLPAEPALRGAAILSRVRAGELAEAVALAEAARQDGIVDAVICGLHGHALTVLGRNEEATEAYVQALALAPQDAYVRHLVAAAGRAPETGRAAPDYVRVVFDGYARRFDAHLLALGYRVPALFRKALMSADGAGALAGPVLDLGCGTGLLAVALSDLPRGELVGVDLSRRMLDLAGKRGLYAELHEADVQEFLAHEPRCFSLVMAGDLMPYFGDLTALLQLVAARLMPGGKFLLSLESLPGGESAPAAWQLGRQARFRHSAAHVRAAAAAASLTVASLRSEVQRYERDEPVPGLLVTLARTAS
jgi:predicted TPR repeat methyltransferase